MGEIYRGLNDIIEAKKPLKILCLFEKLDSKPKRLGTKSKHNCQCMTITGKNKPAFATINEDLGWR